MKSSRRCGALDEMTEITHTRTLDADLSRPLAGKRIVITRARPQASALAQTIEELGAEVIEFPTIEIEPPASYAPLDRAIEKIDT